MNTNPMLLCDFYKLSHRRMYPPGTEMVYSTWTPRGTRLPGFTSFVWFGLQAVIKQRLLGQFQQSFFDAPVEQVVDGYARIVKHTLGESNPDVQHIRDLHDLGYLPLRIRALPEGTRVPLRTPVMTIENTDPRFFWLTNYLETLLSCELWKPSTSATIAAEYRRVFNAFAVDTVGDDGFCQFQGHDFSMRGLSSLEAGILSGLGHLTSFVGTDTIPAIEAAEMYYNANVETELVGTSVPATEHSVQCAYGNDDEYVRSVISDVHPTGIVSVVSDGYDFWDVVLRVLPSLKSTIMARDGKVVIRPDSGDPVKIVCGDPEASTEHERKGAIECLWDTFGGTETALGYKQLDSHIGLIYGDAITLERASGILALLKAKGFASTNVVFGIGSYTYQHNTRDTFGLALKSTAVRINGEEKPIFKCPKTDDGEKVSQRGRVQVWSDGGHIQWRDDALENIADLLDDVFLDGQLVRDESLQQIRDRVLNGHDVRGK